MTAQECFTLLFFYFSGICTLLGLLTLAACLLFALRRLFRRR